MSNVIARILFAGASLVLTCTLAFASAAAPVAAPVALHHVVATGA